MRSALTLAALALVASPALAAFSVSSTNPDIEINGVAVGSVTVADVSEGTGSLSVDLPLDSPSTSVAALTPFSSYMFNVASATAPATEAYTLTLTFDKPIIGFQFTTGDSNDGGNNNLAVGLDALTNSVATGTFSPIAHQGNFNSPSDTISVSGSSIYIAIAAGQVGSGVDPFRVITQPVPEFASLLTWASLAGIGCVVARRKIRPAN